MVAVLLGAALVFFLFPSREAERELLAQYEAEDAVAPAPAPEREPRPEAGPFPEPAGS
jgi:MFS transporter, DHA2 family, multidrug resistance protein